MSTSDISDRESSTDSLPSFPEAVSRYDFTLAVIPAAFLLSLFAGQLLAVSTRSALLAASLVGALALLDGLFINPPRSNS